jgi:hypothetical protein
MEGFGGPNGRGLFGVKGARGEEKGLGWKGGGKWAA